MNELICSRCGDPTWSESSTYIVRNSESQDSVCVDCLEPNDVIECRECGKQVRFDDTVVRDGMAYCEDCVKMCNCCGATITPDDEGYYEGDGVLCAACASCDEAEMEG